MNEHAPRGLTFGGVQTHFRHMPSRNLELLQEMQPKHTSPNEKQGAEPQGTHSAGQTVPGAVTRCLQGGLALRDPGTGASVTFNCAIISHRRSQQNSCLCPGRTADLLRDGHGDCPQPPFYPKWWCLSSSGVSPAQLGPSPRLEGGQARLPCTACFPCGGRGACSQPRRVCGCPGLRGGRWARKPLARTLPGPQAPCFRAPMPAPAYLPQADARYSLLLPPHPREPLSVMALL